ncbi:triple gene block 2 [Yam virus X]|uniref:Triple gene block 2 n=1 Tax=Yam virus X TaxID=1503864 RepID=A0A096XLL9_9VIRU|nr:triple gene block 2 [Yam virus X]AIB00371.1 triple gene block 2 [Yam virus X]
MPLTPPPDHSTTFRIAAATVGLALIFFTLTRSTLPHVGDNIHHLPHGGCYRDGTKTIKYNSPSANANNTPAWALPAVLILSALIYATSRLASCSVTSTRYCIRSDNNL